MIYIVISLNMGRCTSWT